MYTWMGILGLLALIGGLYALAKGHIGQVQVTRPRAIQLSLCGAFLLPPAIVCSNLTSQGAGIVTLLAWISAWIAGYGIMRGQLGPIHGRGRSALVLVITLVLVIVAASLEVTTDRRVAAAVERDRQEAAAKALKDKEDALARKYGEAVALVKEGRWAEAAKALEGIPGYLDADAQLVEARYQAGLKSVVDKSWQDALVTLQQVPTGYKEVASALSKARDGVTSQYFAEAMDAKGAKNYDVAAQKLQAAKDAGGTAPGDLEAEILAVADLRAAAQKAEAERLAKEQERQARIDREAGPKPENSAWDAAVFPVTQFLKKNLKDPKSVEYIEWSPVQLLERQGQFYWAVRCKYRAKNSFGGYVIEQKVFFIQHDQVVDYVDF